MYLRQPRVVGEIAAGLLLSPALIDRLRLHDALTTASSGRAAIIDFVYWLGLLLLMFLSGAEARQLFGKEERREVTWLAVVGTGIPFVIGLGLGPWLITPSLSGPNGNRLSLTIIMAVGVAVTSVPVISKIFSDLNILQTRFARLVLGVAVLEDLALWLALAVATTVSGKSGFDYKAVGLHLTFTIAFFALGATLLPRAVKRLNKARFNILARHSPVAYTLGVFLAYCVVAGVLNVNMVFAAFLAGFAVVHKKRKLFDESLEAIRKISFAFFIPIYFAIVGMKLNLGRGFSLWLTLAFLAGTCLVKIASVYLAGRCAGFRGLDLVNLAFTTNARGGPGIVLASVAFDAGIISARFYTTLVLVAILTSQIAGAWLEYVLRKGWPLLSSETQPKLAPLQPVESSTT